MFRCAGAGSSGGDVVDSAPATSHVSTRSTGNLSAGQSESGTGVCRKWKGVPRTGPKWNGAIWMRPSSKAALTRLVTHSNIALSHSQGRQRKRGCIYLRSDWMHHLVLPQLAAFLANYRARYKQMCNLDARSRQVLPTSQHPGSPIWAISPAQREMVSTSERTVRNTLMVVSQTKDRRSDRRDRNAVEQS
jgi:hypothetical protein